MAQKLITMLLRYFTPFRVTKVENGKILGIGLHKPCDISDYTSGIIAVEVTRK